MPPEVQQAAESLDFGAAGFDAAMSGGFALSEGLDGACCPKVPDPVASQASTDPSPSNQAASAPVQIHIGTMEEVKSAVVENEIRLNNQVVETPQSAGAGESLSISSPQGVETKPSPLVADGGVIDYASANFDFGGPQGSGVGAGIGFSLSESLTRDCCTEPTVATAVSGSGRIEGKVVEIQEKSLDEVKATAVVNDSKTLLPDEQQISRSAPRSPENERAGVPHTQQHQEVVGAHGQGDSILLKNTAGIGQAEAKPEVTALVRELPKAMTNERVSVNDKPSIDLISPRNQGTVADTPERTLSARAAPVESIRSLKEPTEVASSSIARTSLNSSEKIQIDSGSYPEQISRSLKEISTAPPGREDLQAKTAAMKSNHPFAETVRPFVEAVRDFAPASGGVVFTPSSRLKERVSVVAAGRLDAPSSERITIEREPLARAIETFRGGVRHPEVKRAKEDTAIVRLQSLGERDPVLANQTIESKTISQRVSALVLAAKDRLMEKCSLVVERIEDLAGIKNVTVLAQRLAGLVKRISLLGKERQIEETGIVRLSGLVEGDSTAAGRTLEKSSAIQRLKLQFLSAKNIVTQKMAFAAEKIASLPGIRSVVAWTQKASELLQRLPISEKLQDFLRMFRARSRNESETEVKLSRGDLARGTNPAELTMPQGHFSTRQRIVEAATRYIQALRNAPGIRQVFLAVKQIQLVIGSLKQQGRTATKKRQLEVAYDDIENKADPVRPRSQFRGQIRQFLNRFNLGKGIEINQKTEKQHRRGAARPEVQKREKSSLGAEVHRDPTAIKRNSRTLFKNHLGRKLIRTAPSLRSAYVSSEEGPKGVMRLKPHGAEVSLTKYADRMSAIPIKKLNRALFLKRQAKRGDLLRLKMLRQRGIRGGRQLKKYLDPRSRLYRRLMRELSIEELDRLLIAMSRQNTFVKKTPRYKKLRRRKESRRLAQSF